jgi:hypothetical protein
MTIFPKPDVMDEHEAGIVDDGHFHGWGIIWTPAFGFDLVSPENPKDPIPTAALALSELTLRLRQTPAEVVRLAAAFRERTKPRRAARRPTIDRDGA